MAGVVDWRRYGLLKPSIHPYLEQKVSFATLSIFSGIRGWQKQAKK